MTAEPSAAEYWQVSHVITRLFGNAEHKLPLVGALQLIATTLSFDVGAIWLVNNLRFVLECAEYFASEPASFRQFEVVTRARKFSVGEGLPGTVWSKRDVVHIPELSKAENFPRMSVAKQEDLHTGIGFPLYFGKTVLGVLELFSREARQLSPELKQFLFALGGQMGVFFERLAAGRELDAANAQLVLLAEAAQVAIFTIDEHSNVIFANPAVESIFGYKPEELIGDKLTRIMPEYLRHVHEMSLSRYLATGERHVCWDGVALPGLHRSGIEIPLMISFGEFVRRGERVFTGFARVRMKT